MASVAAALLLGLRALATMEKAELASYWSWPAGPILAEANAAGPSAAAAWVYTAAALVLAAAWALHRERPAASAMPRPPWAPGWRLPLLGHALSYKADPPGFLR